MRGSHVLLTVSHKDVSIRCFSESEVVPVQVVNQLSGFATIYTSVQQTLTHSRHSRQLKSPSRPQQQQLQGSEL